MLSTVAGSMMTITSVTFSITIVALQLASSQFGPRLLRNFMRDRGNQVALGTFIATFTYCLLVLRTVNGTEGEQFVPHLSVTVGLLLALASLGMLIYFFHHAAASIQAENVIAEVSRELHQAIDRLYPECLGQEPPEGPARERGRDLPAGFDREVAADRRRPERLPPGDRRRPPACDWPGSATSSRGRPHARGSSSSRAASSRGPGPATGSMTSSPARSAGRSTSAPGAP